MRAITVNENANFERGQDPKAVMDVGGVSPWDIQDEIESNAEKAWDDYIKSFIGKEISGIFKVDPFKSEQCSFKVKDVEYEYRSGIPLSIGITFEGEDGNFYGFKRFEGGMGTVDGPNTNKIFIKNEG